MKTEEILLMSKLSLITTLNVINISYYKIQKRAKQSKTFTIRKRVKRLNLKKDTNSELNSLSKRVNNYDILSPNLFAYCNIGESFYNFNSEVKIKLLNEAGKLVGMNRVERAFKDYNALNAHLETLNQKSDIKLFMDSDTNPSDHLNYYKIFVETQKDIPNIEESIVIIQEFNVSCAVIIDRSSKVFYRYFSEKGAFEIDIFLQGLNIKKSITDFQNLSYNPEFIDPEMIKIRNNAIKNLEEIKLLNKSIYKETSQMVSDSLAKSSGHELKTFIRTMLSIAYVHSSKSAESRLKSKKKFKYNDEENEPIKIINNVSFIKLLIPYTGFILEVGEMFLTNFIFEKTKIINMLKDDDCPDIIINLFQHFSKSLKKEKMEPNIQYHYNNYEFLLFGLISAGATITDSQFKYTGEKTLQKYLSTIVKETKFGLDTVDKLDNLLDLHFIINFDPSSVSTKFMVKNISIVPFFEVLRQPIVKIMTNCIKEQMTKVKAVIGNYIIELLGSFIHIDKASPDVIYLNEEFYRTSKHTTKYPFFSLTQITNSNLSENLIGVHDKIKHTFNNVVSVKDQPMYYYSGKYSIEYVNPRFNEQLYNSMIHSRCQLDDLAFEHFLNAIKYYQCYIEGSTTEISEVYLKYVLPKETNLNILKISLKDEEYKNVIKFVCDLNQLSIKAFRKTVPKLYGFDDFVLSCINHKLEILDILGILPIIISFHSWFPRIWSDSRGRQYAYETPLNINKSPNFRALFSYLTATNYSEPIKQTYYRRTLKSNEKELLQDMDLKIKEIYGLIDDCERNRRTKHLNLTHKPKIGFNNKKYYHSSGKEWFRKNNR